MEVIDLTRRILVIPLENASYCSTARIMEIPVGLQQILNPDRYFSTKEEYMIFCSGFMDKFMFVKETEP